MVVIDEPRSTEVQDLRGLHLYYFESSTCSKKVRMVLGLLGLEAVLHHVDLAAHENKTVEFLGINPRGLVPVLIDEGVVHVESNDIVAYLLEREGVAHLLDAAARADLVDEDALHTAMRSLTFTFHVPPSLAVVPEEKMETYRARGGTVAGHGQDFGAQVQFWTDFGANGGVPPARCVAAYDEVAKAFTKLEDRLSENENGEDPSFLYKHKTSAGLGVSDIVWFPTVRRVQLCGYDVAAHHPRLGDWVDRCLANDVIEPFAEHAGLVNQAYKAHQYLTGTELEPSIARWRLEVA